MSTNPIPDPIAGTSTEQAVEMPQMSKGLTASISNYSLRVVKSDDDLRRAQALRFQVFNLELNEGLSASFQTGLDRDEFDDVCDHLLVEEKQSGSVVGTYRMQMGMSARANLGYYSEQEFDFTPYESIRGRVVELGRACVHRDHRNFAVLNLLWKGIAQYARQHGGRYLIGCSSLTSQMPEEGAGLFELLRTHLVEPEFRTVPLPAFRCPLETGIIPPPKPPKLLAAYLMIGARICGPPAIDREFKTIDFLTLLDLESLPPRVSERFIH